MAYNKLPDRNHKITEEQRQEYLNRVSKQALSGSEVRSFRFHSDQVKELVSQDGAVEFAVEKGVDEKGSEVAILICKDKEGKKLPIMLELSQPCPPWC